MSVDAKDIYIPPRQSERSSFKWLGMIAIAVMLGIYIIYGIRTLAKNAWIDF